LIWHHEFAFPCCIEGFRDVFSPFTPTYYALQIVYYPTFILVR
jgi:hypothetical protein